MRLHYFDNFRAIAILMVITGHCYHTWLIDTRWETAIANTITGASTIFVFISGFFLHNVFYDEFNYQKFMRKKTQALLIPYTVLTILYFILFIAFFGEVPFPENVPVQGDFLKIIAAFFSGTGILAYWFIPFIIVMFLLSPLILLFIPLPRWAQLTILGVLFIGSALAHRPISNFNPLHSVIYYLPFFLLGIFYSLNREEIGKSLGKCVPVFVLGFAFTLLVQNIVPQIGNVNKWIPWSFNGWDFMVLQKLCLIFVIVWVLQTYADREIKSLRFIADFSFPLFFIHPWVIGAGKIAGIFDGVSDGFGGVLVLTVLVVLGSALLALTAQRLLGHRSRYLIGS